jgi:hypothetical protein
LFGGRLLSEIDAERYWDKNFVQAAAKMWSACRRQHGFVVAERELPTFIDNSRGEGRTNLMNISIVEYLFWRTLDPLEAAEYRAPIVKLLRRAGVEPWVDAQVDEKRPARTEITYWQREDRVVVCVARNPLVLGQPPVLWDESVHRGEETILRLIFSSPKRNVVNELTGETLGDGTEFEVEWETCEAVMISFETEIAR